VILGILPQSSHFDFDIFLNLAKKYIQNIRWFGSEYVETIDAINIAYTRLFQQMSNSREVRLLRIKRIIEHESLLPIKRNNYSLPVLQVLEIIDRDYSQPLSLSILSNRVGVHPTYLSNLFKKQIGLTLIDYINRRRVEKAKILLEDPLNKIFWISEQVGFMNQRYFSQVFKRITGLTPIEYRSNFFLASASVVQDLSNK
jgi:YesN/AraC family two-component response regulator